MSDTSTKRMISAYIKKAADTLFLAGMFQTPAENFYEGEKVEIDIERSGEDVAVVVQDLGTGYRANSDDLYVNKEFKAPVYKEALPINSFDLIKRTAGDDPFKNPVYRANLTAKIFKGVRKIEQKIRRAIELQASQVLQTGKVSLTDQNGVALYELNYQPKLAHFPTVLQAWSDPTSNPLQDLAVLSETLRNNGLDDPDMLVMGDTAYANFIRNDIVQKALDNRRINEGDIGRSEMRGKGGMYRGSVDINNYKFEIWTYGGRFDHPTTGVKTRYVEENNVIMRASSGRLDATFGAIPNIGRLLGLQQAVLGELPGRISNDMGGMDLHLNAWVTNDGEQLWAGVGARPLLIPTAIDTFGCLTTQP